VIELLSSWIIGFIAKTGYLGIFFLMMIESALIPMPSEVTMSFSGFLVTSGQLNLWLIVIVGTLGNLVGSLIAYFLGAWGQETVVRVLIKKYGKYIFVSEHEFDRSEKWFRKHGEIIVFVSRLLPAVRTYISLPAGIAKMNLVKFSLYTLLGSFLWSFILTYIGVILGKNWVKLGAFFHLFDIIIVLGVAFLVFRFAWKKWEKHKNYLHN
jgi:membrane protein DedA with SNARE-associated domain